MKTKKDDERKWIVTPYGAIRIYERAGYYQLYVTRKGRDEEGKKFKSFRKCADTNSYDEARRKAQGLIDSWNPDKLLIADLQKAKEQAEVPIAEAVAAFLRNAQERLGDDGAGTVAEYRVVLGPTKRSLSLLTWLEQYNAKRIEPIKFTSQLAPAVLGAWRQSWALNPSTKRLRWTVASMFIQFCMRWGWITGQNPHEAVGKLAEVTSGGTGIFSDEQWLAFESCCTGEERAFFSLMRWGGCALVDAVTFNKRSLTGDVLNYHRYKLRRKAQQGWARVTLPRHVVEMLSMLPEEPFRGTDSLTKVRVMWSEKFQDICVKAGITAIETEHGTEAPHTHCLRDTCAVTTLKKTRDLVLVARVLGHSSTAITERHYLPYVKALQEQHDQLLRAAVADVVTLETTKVVQ